MKIKNIKYLVIAFCFVFSGLLLGVWLYFRKRINTQNSPIPSTGNIQKTGDSIVNNIVNELETSLNLVAGEDLPNNSVVVIIDNKAYLFDATNEEHFSLQCGIILSGVSMNQITTVYLSGTVNLIGSVLNANTKYFAGVNGILIEEISNDYGIQSVGYAISSNQIILDFSEQYSL